MNPPNPRPDWGNPAVAPQTDDPADLQARIDALQARLNAMHPLPTAEPSQATIAHTADALQARLDAMHPLPIPQNTANAPATATTSALPAYKRTFLSSCLSASILTFGNFTLKSGRRSPYFFNAGLFHKASLLRSISTAYAQTLINHSASHPDFQFDVVFGPAYKGIALAAATVDKLAVLDGGKYGEVSFSFNRKEAKDHGEGGNIVGANLKGKKILILDDVITAGTAMREACGIIAKEGGILVGVIVALDRMERMPGNNMTASAIGEVRREYGVPVLSIVTMEDLIRELKLRGIGGRDLARMEEYKRIYGAYD